MTLFRNNQTLVVGVMNFFRDGFALGLVLFYLLFFVLVAVDDKAVVDKIDNLASAFYVELVGFLSFPFFLANVVNKVNVGVVGFSHPTKPINKLLGL